MQSRKIAFVDDNVIGHRKYAKQLFNELVPLKIRWVGECTLDIADDPEAYGRYRHDIPVVWINGRELGRYPIAESALVKALRAAESP